MLTEREREIVSLSYGLDGQEAGSMEDIARRWRVQMPVFWSAMDDLGFTGWR